MNSFYKCPACQAPLKIAIDSFKGFDEDALTMVFCSNPRCPSDVSRIGRKARTEADAYKALCATVDAEADESRLPVLPPPPPAN